MVSSDITTTATSFLQLPHNKHVDVAAAAGCFHHHKPTNHFPTLGAFSSPFMAEDEEDANHGADPEPAGPSTSRADDWLQLGIGHFPSGSHRNRGEPRELHLFPHLPSRVPTTTAAAAGTSGFRAFPQYPPQVPWGAAGTSGGPAPPPRLLAHAAKASGSTVAEFRVVGAPPRPQTGFWFALLAAQLQAREPYLPQISKKYLRIKDGRMTIRLLMKYLAIKLGLDSESEPLLAAQPRQHTASCDCGSYASTLPLARHFALTCERGCNLGRPPFLSLITSSRGVIFPPLFNVAMPPPSSRRHALFLIGCQSHAVSLETLAILLGFGRSP